MDRVHYLDYIIDHHGVHVDPTKIQVIHDGLLCRLGHLCVPSSEHMKLIWEAHYSQVAGHFGV